MADIITSDSDSQQEYQTLIELGVNLENFDLNSTAWQIFWKMYKNDRVSKELGMIPLVINQGYNSFQMEVKNHMLNGFDILHGGILFAFADSVFAFASNSYGSLSVTTNVQINYLESVKKSDILISETQLIKLTNKFCNLNVMIYRYEKHIKTLIGTFYGTAYRTSKAFEI